MTRRITGLALFLLAAWSGSVALGQQGGAINYGELFQSLDADNDQVIVRGEVPESGRAAFDRLVKLGDSNKDGKIDRQEYRALLENARDTMGLGGERFKTLDKNGDGKISRDEFVGPPALFARIDANQDGVLSREEGLKFSAANGAGGMGQFGPRYQAMDKNNDGKVSRDEFTGPPALFDRIDADKNGQLIPSEVRVFQMSQLPATKKADKPVDEAKKPPGSPP